MRVFVIVALNQDGQLEFISDQNTGIDVSKPQPDGFHWTQAENRALEFYSIEMAEGVLKLVDPENDAWVAYKIAIIMPTKQLVEFSEKGDTFTITLPPNFSPVEPDDITALLIGIMQGKLDQIKRDAVKQKVEELLKAMTE